MQIRRLHVIQDRIFVEGGLPATRIATRVAASAVIVNPSADQTPEDLSTLISYGATLGEQLSREAVAFLKRPVVSFGKAALIGTSGDIEHGAAIMHPKMGMSMRAIIGGGKAIIPSNVKIGAAGTTIDVPLGHRDNPWSFDEIDTLTVQVPGAPRPDEIIVIVAFADGGRPRPRIAASPTAREV
jgi:hypothetical protein